MFNCPFHKLPRNVADFITALPDDQREQELNNFNAEVQSEVSLYLSDCHEQDNSDFAYPVTFMGTEDMTIALQRMGWAFTLLSPSCEGEPAFFLTTKGMKEARE